MPKGTTGQHRRRTCTEKKRYASYDVAWLARKGLPHRDKLDLYGPCKYCGGYHLGHKLVDHMNTVKAFEVVLPRELKKKEREQNGRKNTDEDRHAE